MTRGGKTTVAVAVTLLGIDVGSSGTRAALYSAATGDLVGIGASSYSPRTAPGGLVEYDAEEIEASVVQAIRQCVEHAGIDGTNVAGIGVTAMMAGVVPVDSRGSPVGPYTTTLDSRFQAYAALDSSDTKRVTELTGTTYSTVAPKLRWIRGETDAVYNRTAVILPISSFITRTLTGESARRSSVDTTQLWMTGLVERSKADWSEDLLTIWDIPKSKLPEIAEPTDIVGTLQRRIAEKISLPAGIPVTAGSGDAVAAVLGASGADTDVAVDIGGTYPVFSLSVDGSPDIVVGTGEVFGSIVKGRTHPSYFIGGAGLAFRWMRENFAGCQDDAIEDRARDLAPGSDGLLCIPHFGGVAHPPSPEVRGAWLGLTWSHKAEHIYRSFLEALALDLRRGSLGLGHLSDYDRVIATGGAAASDLTLQIKADVFGVPYTRSRHAEPGTFGAAIAAGVGVGVFEHPSDAIDLSSLRTQTFRPDQERHETYVEIASAYCEALDAARSVGNAMSRVDRKGQR